jgi:plastocyanin
MGIKTFKVEITIGECGEIKYSNDYFEVDWGDQIKWEYKGRGHYAIHLGPETPFEWQSQDKKSDGTFNITGTVKENAVQVEYKYFVAIYDGKNLFTDDPKFIVKRRRGE